MEWNNVIYLGIGSLFSLISIIVSKIFDNQSLKRSVKINRLNEYNLRQMNIVEKIIALFDEFADISQEIIYFCETSNFDEAFDRFNDSYFSLYNRIVSTINKNLVYLNGSKSTSIMDIRDKFNSLYSVWRNDTIIEAKDALKKFNDAYDEYIQSFDEYHYAITEYFTKL